MRVVDFVCHNLTVNNWNIPPQHYGTQNKLEHIKIHAQYLANTNTASHQLSETRNTQDEEVLLHSPEISFILSLDKPNSIILPMHHRACVAYSNQILMEYKSVMRHEPYFIITNDCNKVC